MSTSSWTVHIQLRPPGWSALSKEPHGPGQQRDRIREIEVGAEPARAEHVLAGLDVRGQVDLLQALPADRARKSEKRPLALDLRRSRYAVECQDGG